MPYFEEIEYAGGDLQLNDEGYTVCCDTDYTNKFTGNYFGAYCAKCDAEVEVG